MIKALLDFKWLGPVRACAMSKKTLQEGVERLLTHYVPEVRGLLGEDDEEAKHKGYTPYFPKESKCLNNLYQYQTKQKFKCL